jgi:hypothetical protein
MAFGFNLFCQCKLSGVLNTKVVTFIKKNNNLNPLFQFLNKKMHFKADCMQTCMPAPIYRKANKTTVYQ